MFAVDRYWGVVDERILKMGLIRQLGRKKENIRFLFVLLCFVTTNFLIISRNSDGISQPLKYLMTNATRPMKETELNFYKVTVTPGKLKRIIYEDQSLKINVAKLPVPEMDGYKLASYTAALCDEMSNTSNNRIRMRYKPNRVRILTRIPALWNKNQNISLCPIWKIGTTFWKRIFMINRERRYQSLKSPYQIPFDVKYESEKMTKNSAFPFMFTRDPYTRLLSAFVDKILAPNPVYWGIIGSKAIREIRKYPSKLSLKCGHDLTFLEFIKHVILSFKTRKNIDGHFQTMTRICEPCEMKYNFIGKMETFKSDSVEMLKKLNMHIVEHMVSINGSEDAADDAIQDTINQPFFFHKHYKGCINFEEAMKRSWRKLQIRGLIGYAPFPFSDGQIRDVTHSTFLDMSRKARHASNSTERKQIQKHAFIEFYRTIPKDDLNQIRRIYTEDFKYFKYDDSPSVVFDTSITEPYYGFANTSLL